MWRALNLKIFHFLLMLRHEQIRSQLAGLRIQDAVVCFSLIVENARQAMEIESGMRAGASGDAVVDCINCEDTLSCTYQDIARCAVGDSFAAIVD